MGSAIHYNLPIEQRYQEAVVSFLSFTRAVDQSYNRLRYGLILWVILGCIATNTGMLSFTALLFNVALAVTSWGFLYILRGYSIGMAAVKYYYQQGVIGRDYIIKQLIEKHELENNPDAVDNAYQEAMEYNIKMVDKFLKYYNEPK